MGLLYQDQLVSKDLRDNLGQQECQGRQVFPVQLDPREQLEVLAQQDLSASLVPKDLPVRLEFREFKVSQEVLAFREQLEPVVSPVKLEFRGLPEHLVLPVVLESRVRLESVAHRAQQE